MEKTQIKKRMHKSRKTNCFITELENKKLLNATAVIAFEKSN